MVIIIFFVAQWYLSLFCQTFFMHRYSAHGDFKMSKFWEHVFFVLSFLTMGSSYLSATAYGIMHRMHHAFADTPQDPHSPKYFPNIFAMMWSTAKSYTGIYMHTIKTDERFSKNVPEWPAFDKFASSNITRLAWIAVYIAFYVVFATHWWLFLLLPITILTGPVHGAIINWFAHKVGYTNFKVNNTSKNLFPIDLFMLGEGYHNNHHKYASSANFAMKWFEFDPVYPVILFFNWIGIIELKKTSLKHVVTEF